MSPIYLLLLFFPLLLLIANLLKTTRNHPFPSPRKLPIIGNLHQLSAHPHHSLHQLSLKHGPIMLLQLGSVPALVISTADALREILKAHDITFSNRPSLYGHKKISYGHLGISFPPYGDYWRQARKLCILEVLSVKRVRSFRTIREEEVANTISDIKMVCPSSNPVNLSEVLHALTCKIATRVMFGDGIVAADGYGELMVDTQRVLGEFWVADYLPWLGWIDALTGLRRRLDKIFRKLDQFYDHLIQEHTTTSANDHKLSDLVHVLLQLHKDPVHGMTFSSMNHIKGIITEMFIGGTDTSASTLTWTMTELMRNPQVMARAIKEVREKVGNKGKVDEDDLEDLNFLKLVIKEAMRLRTPVPLIPRETTETCIIQGHRIPNKTRVLINVRAISLDPNTWDNPEEFQPERFVSNDVDFKGQDCRLVPFGFGRRSCPGINFALPVVELVLANILYSFDWDLPADMTKEQYLDVEEELGTVVHKKNPLVLIPKLVHHNVTD